MIVVVGIISLVAGLWIIYRDLDELARLLPGREGWVYLLPLFLVAGDLCLTLFGLSASRVIMELNPLVSGVLQAGSTALAAFTVSYMALSEGLGLLMLQMGCKLFPSRSSRHLPYAATCGAASFGLGSNLVLLTAPSFEAFSYLGGIIIGALVAALVFESLRPTIQTSA